MNDTDLEQLELAAKAAWIEAFFDDDGDCYRVNSNYWDPRHDDGDALRLAVKAGIDLTQFDDFARADCMEYVSVDEPYGGNPLAATRRVIVKAAAEIGRNMK